MCSVSPGKIPKHLYMSWAQMRVHKASIIIYLLATFVLGLVFYFAYRSEKNGAIRQETEKLTLNNRLLQEHVAFVLRSAEDDNGYLAESPTLHNFVEDYENPLARGALKEFLQQFLAHKRDILAVEIFDSHGRPLREIKRRNGVLTTTVGHERWQERAGFSDLEANQDPRSRHRMSSFQIVPSQQSQTREVVIHSAIHNTTSRKGVGFVVVATHRIAPIVFWPPPQTESTNFETHILTPEGQHWTDPSSAPTQTSSSANTFTHTDQKDLWQKIRKHEQFAYASPSLLLASAAVKIRGQTVGFLVQSQRAQHFANLEQWLQLKYLAIALLLNLMATAVFAIFQYLILKRREAQKRVDQSLKLERIINRLLDIQQRNQGIPTKLREMIAALREYPLFNLGTSSGFFMNENGQLNLIVDQGLDEEFKHHGHALFLHQSLWGQIAKGGEIRYVERLTSAASQDLESKNSGYLVIPVTRDADVLGILILGVVRKKNHSPQFEKHFFIMVSEVLSAMIQGHQQERQIESQRAKIMASSRVSSLAKMAGGIAREINNPLTIILGYSQTLENVASSLSYEHAKSVQTITERIRTSAHRIAKIVTNLREISQDGLAEEMSIVAVTEVLDPALQQIQDKLKKHSIQFEVESSIDDGRILCQKAQMTQVLFNVLDNAIDAVTALQQKWIHLTVVESEYKVTLRITDSGYLSPNLAETIFTPFFSTKETDSGSGLGLSMARRIVEAHGGSLYLDTSTDHTCFVINLPKAQTQNVQAAS